MSHDRKLTPARVRYARLVHRIRATTPTISAIARDNGVSQSALWAAVNLPQQQRISKITPQLLDYARKCLSKRRRVPAIRQLAFRWDVHERTLIFAAIGWTYKELPCP